MATGATDGWQYVTLGIGADPQFKDIAVQARNGSVGDISLTQGKNRLSDYLNEVMGPEGWELCGVVDVPGARPTLIFKKPL